MSRIKVLIADDSVVYRSQIRAALSHLSYVEVIGAVSNGRLAIDKLKVSPADLLVLDLEMPELDGLQTLAELSRLQLPTKVLMFSSFSKRGAETTLEALRLGAADFITKPGSGDAAEIAQSGGDPSLKIRTVIEPKILALFPSLAKVPSPQVEKPSTFPPVIWDLHAPRIVVIGSSTGGPTVLEKIFASIKPPVRTPIVIVQHMPPLFTATFAERIGRLSGLPAAEAKHGDILQKGHVYVAPGDFHVRLSGSMARTEIHLDQGPMLHFVRPAVDPLFESAAQIYGEHVLGLVLTGMGNDGRQGAQAVKKARGAVAIQSRETCTVFGMPRAVFEAGAYDKILDPDSIIRLLQEKVGEISRVA